MLKELAVATMCVASYIAFAAGEPAPFETAAAGDSAVNVALEEGETSIVSAEFYLNFDSRYLSYGLVDNKDPILTPGGSLAFFDIFGLHCEVIFDTTKYGHKAGYTSRRFQYTGTCDKTYNFASDLSLKALF